jgi:hypothetical protein
MKAAKNTEAQAEEQNKPTAEQIAEWKAKYGDVFRLPVEDGRVAYIFSPTYSLPVMKLVFSASMSSDEEMGLAILENCWLHGDESVKTDDSCLYGFIDELKNIMKFKDCKVEYKNSELPTLVVGSFELKIRKPNRQDCINGAKHNRAKEAFETNVEILKGISIDKDQFEIIRQNHVPELLAMAVKVDELKARVVMSVEKL